jgi:hypothetical protein
MWRRTLRAAAVIAACLAVISASAFAAAARPTTQPTTIGRTISAAKLGTRANPSLGDILATSAAGSKIVWAVSAKMGIVVEDRPTPLMATPVLRPAGISEYGQGKLLLGDAANNDVYVIDLASKQVTKLFSLASLAADPQMTKASILKQCELASLAFDGKYIYAGVRAGYASSIFKIDPAAGKIVGHAWSPGPDPTAMQFNEGNLYVLDGEGRKIRRYDGALKLSLDSIETGVADAKGLAIVGGQASILSAKNKTITVLKPDWSKFKGVATQPLITNLTASGRHIVPVNLPQKYAVLISTQPAETGYDENWNDLCWFYKTLRSKGYTPDNIFAIYAYGHDSHSANPKYCCSEIITDFPGNMVGIQTVFIGLRDGSPSFGIPKITQNDSLLVWIHGPASPSNGYIETMAGTLTDAMFAGLVNPLPCKKAIFIQQNGGGSFLDDLANPTTFASSAATAGHPSYRIVYGEYYYNTAYHHCNFTFGIVGSFDGKLPIGAAVNADADASGKVSAREAFQWELAHRLAPDTPQSSDPTNIGPEFYLK